MRLQLVILCLLPIALSAISDEEFFEIQRARRRVSAHTVKANAAAFDEAVDLPGQGANGDEGRYADLRGSFNKGLQHLSSGYPNGGAFKSLVKALSTGLNRDFDAIAIGQGVYRLVSPQSSLCFSLSGNDAWLNAIPPAPAFSSAQTAGEMVEVYWTALVRNVPFNEFGTDGMVAAAVADLNILSDFRGPKVGGVVTPGTFLRGNTPGDLVGPYISQFLYLEIPFGATSISSSIRVPKPDDNDFLTDFTDWFDVVTGGTTGETIDYEDDPIFIRNPRDLTEYVHQDTPGQAGLGALLILNSFGPAALDPANLYVNNLTQEGFVTFGIGQYLDLVRNAVQEGLKASWCQKWQVHRRLRPEEYGFYVQQQKGGANLGINPQLINSAALPEIKTEFGSYFLPLAYPEGSPVHPSYPAGHATFIGAAVTVLKALFNEDFEIPSPLQPSGDNMTLVGYGGPPLTVGGELNKLAANLSLGRDHAGVHYRSDGFDGMNLGEAIAIDILNNESFLFNENFNGYTLTKFDGTKITVGQKRETY